MVLSGGHFYLVPTNHTRALSEALPAWGLPWLDRRVKGLSRKQPRDPSQATLVTTSHGLPLHLFQHTHWTALQHVIVHALGRHRQRTHNARLASVCVVAAPPGGACEAWEELCPGRPLAVIDHVDLDDKNWKWCPTLWGAQSCRNSSTLLLRVVGAPAVFNRRLGLRGCQRTISMPWLSHVRSPDPAYVPRERGVRVAFAAGVAGHSDAQRRGYEAWRRELRNACIKLRNASKCSRTYQSLQGGMARAAVELYSNSVFCLQPPGDTLPRAGIVDAISVGCIPVFLHAAQRDLWPLHWDASKSSKLYDWQSTRHCSRRPGRCNASGLILDLLSTPDAEVRALQAAVAHSAQRMYYRGELGEQGVPDAIDVLVRHLLMDRTPRTPGRREGEKRTLPTFGAERARWT